MADAELTHDERTDGEDEESTVELTVADSAVTVSLPPDADESEAAAIATAVGAHLRDRAAATVAAASADDEPDPADAWKLAGRMKSVGRSRWPDDVRRGDEWKAAARSFY